MRSANQLNWIQLMFGLSSSVSFKQQLSASNLVNKILESILPNFFFSSFSDFCCLAFSLLTFEKKSISIKRSILMGKKSFLRRKMLVWLIFGITLMSMTMMDLVQNLSIITWRHLEATYRFTVLKNTIMNFPVFYVVIDDAKWVKNPSEKILYVGAKIRSCVSHATFNATYQFGKANNLLFPCESNINDLMYFIGKLFTSYRNSV